MEAAGYRVDILSRGPDHPDARGRVLRVCSPSLWRRVLLYLLPSYLARFRLLVAQHLPTEELAEERYDAVNDHQLLPWIVEEAPGLTDGAVVLDLHELYGERGTSLPNKLVIAPYE